MWSIVPFEWHITFHYRPQGKVMFSEASVILSTGVCDVPSSLAAWSHVLSKGSLSRGEKGVFVHRGEPLDWYPVVEDEGGGSLSKGVWGLCPEGGPPGLTSSGGHCSDWYASYWNASLLGIVIGWLRICLFIERRVPGVFGKHFRCFTYF